MKYEKSALSFEEQADQLLSRGMEADRDELLSKLKVVNYYRLSGYWFPFRAEKKEGLVRGKDCPMLSRCTP